ncbi:MAG: trigger factor [Gammaproteobacteria bacterium]|nr:trigger factor [Gammaproteobacteria bacterium]NNJ73065.1 trigger factor [Enterobacterales bacterium]
MQVSVETTSGLERKVSISTPSDVINSDIQKRLQQLSKTQRMAGFRPGKIPMSVIKKRFGGAVTNEILQEVMSRSFYQAIQEQNLQPAGQPMLDAGDLEGTEFTFTATFEVFPEITLTEFSKLKIEKPESEIKDKDIDRMLDNLLKQKGTWEPVKRMAKKDDTVVIDFVGTIDGEAFEGGTAEGFNLVLGSDSMIPGFEKQLLKVKTGEERQITVTFPEDYQSAEVAGKEAVFDVTVKEVKGLKTPELDDEFVKEFGVEDGGVDQLKAEIQKNMQRELDAKIKGEIKTKVFESLQEANEVEIPKPLIDQEIQVLKQQAVQQFSQGRDAQIDLPDLPSAIFEDQAKKRVELALLVNQIIQDNELKVDADRVKETIETMASAYDEPEQMVNWYYSNQEQLQQVESAVMEDQVVDLILEQANVKSKSFGFDELMNPNPSK